MCLSSLFDTDSLCALQKYPKAAQFKNKGFPLYKAVDSIVPDKAKGKHLFAASQASVPDPLLDPSSAPVDEDNDGDSSDLHDVAAGSQEMDPADASQEMRPSDGRSPTPYTPPPAPPAPLGRKRSALEAHDSTSRSVTPTIVPRPPRETAVSRSIDRMSEVLAAAVAGPSSDGQAETSLESTPKRRRIAVELAVKQEEDELSENDMVDFIEVIRERSSSIADTYLSLSKGGEKIRRAWVRRVLSRQYD